jgi:hypothetical protein
LKFWWQSHYAKFFIATWYDSKTSHLPPLNSHIIKKNHKLNSILLESNIPTLTMCNVHIWTHAISNLVWKNFFVYKSTRCKWRFKQLCNLFFRAKTKVKQRSSSIESRTWTVAIFASLKYFGKRCDNNCDAWTTCHNYIKGFIKTILSLSIAMVITIVKCNFLKVYQNLVTIYVTFFCLFHLAPFYHLKTHFWMIMMESRLVMV